MSTAPDKLARVMRGTLEHIRDRFSTEHERYALFTTFNFVSQFFEANVLPLLVGDSVDDLKGASETRYAINDELGKLKCVVACDRSTGPEPKGDLRYGVLPVGLPSGRFHPKIMLMAGTLRQTRKPGLWLSVGSGNLSLSGWAMNREIVGMTAVGEQHARELIPLIEWLKGEAQRYFEAGEAREEGDIRTVLDKLLMALSAKDQLAPAAAGAPTLHLSLPLGEGPHRSLLDSLSHAGPWQSATIVSPYWSSVPALVKKLGVKECCFVPSLLPDGTYRFPHEPDAWPQAVKQRYGKFSADGERYTHAKALMLEDASKRQVLCIGSANFTQAAMLAPEGDALANVEAMLRYDLGKSPNPWAAQIEPLVDPSLVDPDPDQQDEHAPPLPPFEAVVLCNWKAHAFSGQLTMTSKEPIRDIVLHVDGLSHRLALTPIHQKQVLPALPFRGSQPVRTFSVSYLSARGTRETFRGLVTQVNAEPDQLGYQPRPRLTKVLELLRGLDPDAPGGKTRRRAAGTGEGEGDGEEESAEPTYDFFALFQGTWKLLEYHRKRSAAGDPPDPYDALAPYGARNLFRAITLQPAITPEEKIGRYIQLAEMRDVLRRLNTIKLPPPEEFESEIENSIEDMRDDIASMLRESPSFTAMFDRDTDDRAERFLEWFHAQIRAEVVTDGDTNTIFRTQARHAD